MTTGSGPEFRTLIIRIATALGLLTLSGTVGYIMVEGWGFFDAFYMVVITITTTGYGEVRPLSTPGRVLSMALMVTGIGVFFYGLNVIIPALVGRRIERWKRVLEDINDHYLLCGFGDMGQEIAVELSERADKSRIVIIDPDQNRVSLAREKEYLSLQGQPSNEETLKEARIEHARAIVAALDDSENGFTIMAAKDLNPKIYAVGVAQSTRGLKNIKRTGADYVLSPYVDTAKKASMLLHNPIAADFSEIVSEIAEVGMIQKVSIQDSSLSGKSLQDLDLRAKSGVLVVAVVREGGILRPTPDLEISLGDDLYMIGNEKELKLARKIIVEST